MTVVVVVAAVTAVVVVAMVVVEGGWCSCVKSRTWILRDGKIPFLFTIDMVYRTRTYSQIGNDGEHFEIGIRYPLR
jgi:hypothetical protein